MTEIWEIGPTIIQGSSRTLLYPSLETLLRSTGGSRFSLVHLAARRGRQINAYYNGLGAEGIGTIIPPQVASTSRKALSIALEEIAAGRIRIGETVPAAFFEFAESILQGPTVEFYMNGSTDSALEALIAPLTRLGALGGYDLVVDELRRGSFWGILKFIARPYGDGRALSEEDLDEIRKAPTTRPIEGIEGDSAVEYSNAVRMLQSLSGSQRLTVLSDTGCFAAIKEGDAVSAWARRLTQAEIVARREGNLNLDLSNVDDVVAFICAGPDVRVYA